MNDLSTETNEKKALDYYEQEKSGYVEFLKELCRIPSVSFPGYPADKMTATAELAKDLLMKSGIENAELLEIEGVPPYVFGSRKENENLPTVLLYAHYDVQPPMRMDVWKSEPFEPVVLEGRLFGRGTADDKAGIIIHLASIAAYLKAGNSLPVNVKILLEGEEEIGSPNLSDFLSRYQDKVAADFVIAMDGTNYSGIPSLTTSMRGMAAVSVEVSVMKNPVHSGIWGGGIPDPSIALCKMLSGLTDDKGRMNIAELWKDVKPAASEEIEDYKKLGMTESGFKTLSEVYGEVNVFGEGHELLENMWRKPSVSINSIQAGDRKLAGNVIMDSAWARVGLRTVPDMETGRSIKILADWLKERCPWGLRVKVEPETGIAQPWVADTKHKVYNIAKKALSEGYERDAVFAGSGASVPLVPVISKKLGNVPVLIPGIGDAYTRTHSENESLSIEDLHRAVRSEIHFFSLVARGDG